jgi:murein DD-endopeptidase MepM/ murein hydrolase activator NlpD
MSNRAAVFTFFALVTAALWLSSRGGITVVPSSLPEDPAVADSEPIERPRWVVTDTIQGFVRRGDRLDAILRRNGVPARTSFEVVQALRRVFDPRRIRPGERYQLELSAEVGLVRLLYQPAPEVEYVVELDSARVFSAREVVQPLRRELKGLAGVLQSSLYESMRALGASAELVVAFADIFQWDIDFFIEPRPGDRFRLVYESFTLEGQEIRLGKILAAEYVLRGKPLIAVHFQLPNGKSGYYDPGGASFQKTYLKSPLNYRRISSTFSRGRRHPILKVVRAHRGVDFAAPAGTPVVAAADGVVIDTGYQRRGLGRFVKIRHKNRRHVTVYGHLQRVARGIRRGVRVAQRQVIGYVGATGLATGPHLHYSFIDNGRAIDPLRIKNVSGDPIPQELWDSFAARRDSLLVLLEKLPGQDEATMAGQSQADPGVRSFEE